ncbi:uncharacterized protein PAC_14971 [Phialocephala subalpina]|uniref:beta-glucosidase n=1 Tax=Phialocephala subalpina TaxID=576137 RepID=A0A1L7XJ63_9HELO|nr:uncharacterized protein PAC_14971 [Phialocephala subalpina]
MLKNEPDYAALATPGLPVAPYALFPQRDFDEGLYIDYRSTLGYPFPKNPTLASSHIQLFQRYQEEDPTCGMWLPPVDLQVSNIGSIFGQEVVQLYVGIPYSGTPIPPTERISKPNITAGGSTQVRFDLTRRDLSVWDVVAQEWVLPAGTSKSMLAHLAGTCD